MTQYDAVIIGSGPAGLTAGLYLCRANHSTVVLEHDDFGGPMKNWELIENYPGYAEGVAGVHLASEMIAQTTRYGLKLEQAEVVGIELYRNSRWVVCADGKGYTATVVIIAGGSRHKKLGVPGEDELQGKGVFGCAFCDGDHFVDRVVAVCGGGDAGITEALYMTRLASRVILFEALPTLTATAVLQERAAANHKLELRCGTRVEAIIGDNHVEAIDIVEEKSGLRETVKVDGVLVDIGLDPNTDYLQGTVPLDSQGQVIVNDRMETEVQYILAAGDIRSGSPRQIVTAVGDGATAAISAQSLLQVLS